MAEIAFPYRIDARGRTAETDRVRHICDLIEALLFTTPRERVMRPTFGANILASLFAPAGEEQAAAARTLIHAALQEHMRDLIELRDVVVTTEESTVEARVVYTILETGEARSDTFRQGVP